MEVRREYNMLGGDIGDISMFTREIKGDACRKYTSALWRRRKKVIND